MAIVSASIDPEPTRDYWGSWLQTASDINLPVYMILNGPASANVDAAKLPPGFHLMCSTEILGPVPAFALGVRWAQSEGADIIACFHTDLRLDEPGWDFKVQSLFESNGKCLLAGFSGASGLGSDDIYHSPYSPYQLARQGFFSNMTEAEKHGKRLLTPRRMACCDGFSLIGRAEFMRRSFDRLEGLGVVHHMQDSALGAFAYRAGGEAWYLPIKCHHAGGGEAVANRAYHTWAQAKGGDQGIWNQSHRLLYEELRGVLPLRIRA
jgi:hypothetical protein